MQNNNATADDNREEGGSPDGTPEGNKFWDSLLDNAPGMLDAVVGNNDQGSNSDVPGYQPPNNNTQSNSNSNNKTWMWLVVGIIAAILIAAVYNSKNK